MAKTKTIRRLKLNTGDNSVNLRAEDFLWSDVVITYIQCEQNTIKNIYKRICTTCLKDDAKSNLSGSLWDGAQQLHNCSQKYGGESD